MALWQYDLIEHLCTHCIRVHKMHQSYRREVGARVTDMVHNLIQVR